MGVPPLDAGGRTGTAERPPVDAQREAPWTGGASVTAQRPECRAGPGPRVDPTGASPASGAARRRRAAPPEGSVCGVLRTRRPRCARIDFMSTISSRGAAPSEADSEKSEGREIRGFGP